MGCNQEKKLKEKTHWIGGRLGIEENAEEAALLVSLDWCWSCSCSPKLSSGSEVRFDDESIFASSQSVGNFPSDPVVMEKTSRYRVIKQQTVRGIMCFVRWCLFGVLILVRTGTKGKMHGWSSQIVFGHRTADLSRSKIKKRKRKREWGYAGIDGIQRV